MFPLIKSKDPIIESGVVLCDGLGSFLILRIESCCLRLDRLDVSSGKEVVNVIVVDSAEGG